MDILIVDDDEALLRALERATRLFGHSVRTASSGDRACDVAAERCPELAIVDLIMPGIDGIETIAQLHRLCRGCRFVILTGAPSKAAGQTDITVVQKPIGLAALGELIRALERPAPPPTAQNAQSSSP